MESYTKLKSVVTSTAVAIGCAGVTFLVLKYKLKHRNAADALNYLTIKNVTTEELSDEVINELRRRIKLHRAVGFDCEWVTTQGRRQPVALVQLSTFDGYCGLFRLNHLKSIPNSLKELLEDENIYKVGVAPFDDAKYLLSDYAVALKSTLDLRHIVELFGHTPGGLAFLAKSELRIILDKSWRVRCSNWEAQELTETQINYAAADAHVAIKIFVNLINEKDGSFWNWFQRTHNNSIWHKLDDICFKYADISFKTKHTAKTKNESMKKEKEGKQVKDNLKIISKRYPYATRSKPLYHNCFLVAPDGELLCTCDTKKAEWYVEKELADIIKENPLTVRLRFEPAGRSVGDVGRYYQLTKENKCVVCGSSNSYIRKNVVPREYRKYFPEIMKDHSSHDVVLLCVGCHQRSNMHDQVVRDSLATRCGAPLSAHGDTKYKEDADCKKIRSAARALLYQSKKHVLPDSRRQELENVVLQHFPEHEYISEELLQEAAEMQVVFENIDYESHGHKVVEYFLKNEGLLRLEELWREHFLVSMRPKFMPELWSVKHNEERLRVRLQEGRLSEEDAKLLGILKT
ncbi:exonuclease 3'-5' domain-containing protein 2 [Battus philenor]|uniref:exonuclease 3'-5' domain-containing protein 2 n=1 Tax=Battus philenor TaxID=42288 RepID=UPI0035CEB318